MSVREIRSLLDSVDLPDPHEFATAYVRHVEDTAERPELAAAVMRWLRLGRI